MKAKRKHIKLTAEQLYAREWNKYIQLAQRKMHAHDKLTKRQRRAAWGADYVGRTHARKGA